MTATENTSNGPATSHVWKFNRIGGLDQVRLDTADDLRHLDQLDIKLWVALSCPVKGLELDEQTLALIDSDKDGRVRVPEVREAVRWICQVLHDPSTIKKGVASVELSNIRDPGLLASAKQVLSNLGKAEANQLTLEEATDKVKIFAHTRYNGDGVITVQATDDAALQQVIRETIDCLGGVADRSGPVGVDAARVEAFYAECQAFLAWHEKSQQSASSILPLGPATSDAVSACQAVRAKIDDFFSRCRVVAYDARATAVVNRTDADYLSIAAKQITIEVPEIEDFPIAHVEAGQSLPLAAGLNPAWALRLAAFRDKVVVPLLGPGRSELTYQDWLTVQARLQPYEQWMAAKAGASVEKLGVARLRQITSENFKAVILELSSQDMQMAGPLGALGQLEKLIRYHRDLYCLLINFVSFFDFYDPRKEATFQCGTLFLDGRSCDLVVQVADAGKHAALAGLAKIYLAYCDCTRPATGQKMAIAAAFTDGTSDNLMAGRNGVFYDRQGRDWEATITKIIDNPISIREAFWSPYKKFVRFIEEQVAKRAAAADSAATNKLSTVATTAVDTTTGKAPPPKPKFEVGTVAALGVGLGAIGSLLGGFVSGFFGLGWFMPIGFLGVVLCISGPSMIIAALKLRQRNLGPILDANGWAVNGNVRINIPFGATLTTLAKLPKNAERLMTDPYAEKKTPWRAYLIALLILTAAAWCVRYWAGNNHWPWQSAPAAQCPPPAPAK